MIRLPIGWLAALLLGGCPQFHAAPPPNAPPGSRFLTVDGVQVRYEDSGGELPAVLLLHGYGSSLDIWRDVADALDDEQRVIAIDLKGFGWTGRPEGDYSPAAQAQLAWAVLDRLAVRDVSIVGHSWGASVALHMVLADGARVRRVALYSAYVYEEQVPSFFRWARISALGEVLFALFYRERIEDRVALAYHDDRFVTVERFDRVESEMAKPGAVAAALATARGQRFAAVQERYETITQPVLLLWCREDAVTSIEYGRRLEAQLPAAELVELERCGHLPMIEAANPSTRRLRRFLTSDRDVAAPEVK